MSAHVVADAAEALTLAGEFGAELAERAADTAAVSVSSDVSALVGTRSAARPLNLDRHWRNARTHTLHDSRRSKLQHLGRHALLDVFPPATGWV